MLDAKMKRIKEMCLQINSKNPIEIVQILMDDPMIAMHGPEHHMVDGAALLVALSNAYVTFDLKEALDEMENRAKMMPGATCGKWGVCGSASSIGAALSIIHGCGPLSDNEYYKDNLHFTSSALHALGEVGGPRCCKRNAFLSLLTATQFVKEKYNIELESSEINCHYSPQNKQCIRVRCPFFKGGSNNV